MSKKETILILAGPTGVGKTEFAIRLARELGTEIVSADSMQVYRYMDIGTAKPTPKERALAKHHLIDFVHPAEPYSAGRYREDAETVLRDLEGRGCIPLVVGGTGLYIRALTQGLFEGPPADKNLRRHLKEKASREGLDSLYGMLKEVDPVSAARIHPHDEPRIIRALEVHRLTGRPISELQAEHAKNAGRNRRFLYYGLSTSRNRLYGRIEERVDAMLERGLLDEVHGLLKMGVPEDAPSMQGLGYRQMIPYLRGRSTLVNAVETLKKESRNYAKRQITWFRAEPRIRWLEIDTFWSRDKALASFIERVSSELYREKAS